MKLRARRTTSKNSEDRAEKGPQMRTFLPMGRQDLNLRPPGPQPGALPDCATPRGWQAGDRNRTRPRSLEGFCAATTLRPHAARAILPRRRSSTGTSPESSASPSGGQVRTSCRARRRAYRGAVEGRGRAARRAGRRARRAPRRGRGGQRDVRDTPARTVAGYLSSAWVSKWPARPRTPPRRPQPTPPRSRVAPRPWPAPRSNAPCRPCRDAGEA